MSSPEAVAALKKRLQEYRGYSFNPDMAMTDDLLDGLLVNEERYGYPFCPCRLATGEYPRDVDAICPCDVRDQDIFEYGSCFCGLYVSREVTMGKKEVQAIPDRRGTEPAANQLWRCQVCGYICARPGPPDTCPICGVTRDRFEIMAWPK